ncbi:MAG: hypothetical protein ACPIOQ_65485, partial [Promethearchaeia archaeon]
DWHAGDARWTDDLASQVPLGVDPRTSVDDGIFALPYDKIINEECISSLHLLSDFIKNIHTAQRQHSVCLAATTIAQGTSRTDVGRHISRGDHLFGDSERPNVL